jgi:hypothetical protein
MIFQDILGVANLVVLAITGIVVWRYTKAAERSNELQQLPLLNFYFKDLKNMGGARLGHISLRNIGNSPAYNISFEEIELQGFRYRFFLDNPMLEIMQEESPRGGVRKPDGATEAFDKDCMWFLSRLIPKTLTHEAIEHSKNNPAFFVARYQGINGKDYYSVFALYCNLPPVGDIFMQFVAHGSGSYSLADAKEAWKNAKKVSSAFSD